MVSSAKRARSTAQPSWRKPGGCAACPAPGQGGRAASRTARPPAGSRPAPARQRRGWRRASALRRHQHHAPGLPARLRHHRRWAWRRLRRPASATPVQLEACDHRARLFFTAGIDDARSGRAGERLAGQRLLVGRQRCTGREQRRQRQRQRGRDASGATFALRAPVRERFGRRARSQIHPQPGERGAQHVVAGVARLGFAPDAAGLVVLPRHPEHLAEVGGDLRVGARGRPAAAGAAPRRGCRGGTRPSPGCR